MAFARHLWISLIFLLFLLSVPLLAVYGIFLKIQKYIENAKHNKKNISGEVAVISGSARGLGRDIAIELAKRGCRIAVVDIRYELAQQTAEYLATTFGIKAKAYKVDVSDYQQLVELKQNVTNDLGHTTILVNNAGIIILPLKPKPEEIQKMINVNFTAVCFANQIFLPKMKELNRGYILTISSVTAFLTISEICVYAACKAALRSLLNGLRLDILNENKNIKSTTVLPWFLTSNKQVEDIANFSFLPKILPLLKSETAAKIAVEAMLNGEEELTIDRILSYASGIIELFPTALKDRLLSLLYKLMSNGMFFRPEGQEIWERQDTLQLFKTK